MLPSKRAVLLRSSHPAFAGLRCAQPRTSLQPFFTTKPTGQGTGLGLSNCYDTSKAHGGELKVENIEGEGAFFIIQLPVKFTA